jgi:hypothetical protein
MGVKREYAMNLVDIVQEQLGGTVLTRLAETRGTSPGNTRTAANAAIPTLLSALGTQAATRDGARNLASVVDSLDDRVLDNLSQSLNGGGGLVSLGNGRGNDDAVVSALATEARQPLLLPTTRTASLLSTLQTVAGQAFTLCARRPTAV